MSDDNSQNGLVFEVEVGRRDGHMFLLAPLQRVSERLATAAMPNVSDTPAYRAFRKEQVYGEALAEALKDGAVTPVERTILDRLLVTLELDREGLGSLKRLERHKCRQGQLDRRRQIWTTID